MTFLKQESMGANLLVADPHYYSSFRTSANDPLVHHLYSVWFKENTSRNNSSGCQQKPSAEAHTCQPFLLQSSLRQLQRPASALLASCSCTHSCATSHIPLPIVLRADDRTNIIHTYCLHSPARCFHWDLHHRGDSSRDNGHKLASWWYAKWGSNN